MALSRAADIDAPAEAPASPQRIVSLMPSLTEVLFAIGAGDRVVGVTTHCTYPPEAATRAQVGQGLSKTLSLERIVGLQPDLVLAGGLGQQEELRALQRMSIPVRVFADRNLEGSMATMLAVGELVGRPDAAAALVERLRTSLAETEQRVRRLKPARRPRVFYLLWDEPLMTAGPTTFIGELITRAGGENIFADVTADFPVVSAEHVLQRDPEIVLAPSRHGARVHAEHIATRPGWHELSALRTQHGVHIIDGDLISRPGPRLAEAFARVVEAIHPGLLAAEP